MTNVYFFERLREVRKAMGLSQVEFAALAGVTAASQVNYEKGTRNPDTSYLAALAGHGVDVLYLVTGRRTPRDPGTLSEAEAALLARYRSGSPALRGYLQELGQAPASGSNAVTIGGDVGQQVNGDQTVTAPMTFNVGSNPRKN